VKQFAVPLPLIIIGVQMGAKEEDIWQIKAWTDAWVQRLGLMPSRWREAHLLDQLHKRRLELEAKGFFSENAVLAAVEGGGTGLGGAVLIAADIPLLFGINLRLIQQIGASYGFDVSSPAYSPLVLAIFNVAASSSRASKSQALREITVAAAAIAQDGAYKGRVSGTFQDQNRHLPREIAKNIAGRKVAQLIPIAGAAIGAGINYWFTTETAETAFMLFRALYIERKERS